MFRLGRFVVFALAAVLLLATPLRAFALGPDAYDPDDPVVMPTLLADQFTALDRTLIGPEMDFARIPVQAGRSYEISVLSKPGYENTSVRLTLMPDAFGSGGSITTLAQATTFPGATATVLNYTATETGNVVLQTELDGAMPSSEYAYWVAVYSAGQMWWEDPYELQEVDPYAAGTMISAGGPAISRAIGGPEDVDTFEFFAPGPGQYVVSTGFSDKELPPDTQLEVWDLSGTTHITNDDGPDGGPLSEVRITATQPDVWRVRVASTKGRQVGPYTLSVAPAPLSTGRVQGTVLGPDGNVMPNASVALVSPDWQTIAQTTADSGGRFDFPAVPFDVPYRVAADAPGAGLVSALIPEVRNLAQPESVYRVLTAEDPSYSCQPRLRLPWVEGRVWWSYLAGVSGLHVEVHDVAGGALLGSGVTDGAGRFNVSLPAGSQLCRVVISDPNGEYRTTWFDRAASEATASTVFAPTFNPLDIEVRKVSDPDAADNVRFVLAGIEVVFDHAAVPNGMGVLPMSPAHPPAPGYRFVAGRYYDIQPYMSYWGGASVTMSIPASETAGASRARLFHWVDGGWQDITSGVDVSAMKVSGRTTSFSEYAVMMPTGAQEAPEVSTPASSDWSVALFAVCLVALLPVVRRLRDSSE